MTTTELAPPGPAPKAVEDRPAVPAADGPAPAAGTQSLASRARADGVRFLLATFTTLTGNPCSKLVPVSAADALEGEGCGFAGYAAGAMGQLPRDPDVVAVPDVSTYTPLTFLRPGLGMVHCDPHVEGVAYPFAPRVVLRRALAAAQEQGLSLKVGAEVEYFLLQLDGEGAHGPQELLELPVRFLSVTAFGDHPA